MKRLLKLSLIPALFLVFINFGICQAKSGDIIGKLYSTDILATVNGVPVESYNIGGKTVILLEDLVKHRATIFYDNEIRTLFVDTSVMLMVHDDIKRDTPGRIIGDIYDSDIVTYLNGKQIRTYSLNGKMAAPIEDIGSPTGYSQYNAKSAWDEASRTVSLSFLVDNSYDAVKILSAKKRLAVNVNHDRASFWIKQSNYGLETTYAYDPEYNYDRNYALYYNKMQIGIVFAQHKVAYHYDDRSQFSFFQVNNLIVFDLDQLQKIADDF